MKGILTFHSIDSSGSVLSYEPRAFADFIGKLIELQVPICDLDSLLDSRTRRGVALTFDDGMASVFTEALPVLKELGIPAHLFLTTSSVGTNNQWAGQFSSAPTFEMLNWSQVEACHAGGMHIENHTANHVDLRKLSDEQIESECLIADEIIGRRLARRPAYFAYPYGYSNARVRRLVANRYRGCMGTQLRMLRKNEDPGQLPRIDTYYLRRPWIYRRFGATSTQAYLTARSYLRTLRSSLQAPGF